MGKRVRIGKQSFTITKPIKKPRGVPKGTRLAIPVKKRKKKGRR